MPFGFGSSRPKPLSLVRAKRKLAAIEAQQTALLRTLGDFSDDERTLDRLLALEADKRFLLQSLP